MSEVKTQATVSVQSQRPFEFLDISDTDPIVIGANSTAVKYTRFDRGLPRTPDYRIRHAKLHVYLDETRTQRLSQSDEQNYKMTVELISEEDACNLHFDFTDAPGTIQSYYLDIVVIQEDS